MSVRDMTSEELAEVVRTVNMTGICPTSFEKACLSEAADRLDKLHKIEQWIMESEGNV